MRFNIETIGYGTREGFEAAVGGKWKAEDNSWQWGIAVKIDWCKRRKVRCAVWVFMMPSMLDLLVKLFDINYAVSVHV